MSGLPSGAKKASPPSVKAPLGGTVANAKVTPQVMLQSEDPVWLCPYCGYAGNSAPALRGHLAGAHSRGRTVKESGSPETGDPLVDGPIPSSLGLLKEEAQAAILTRQKTNAELGIAKAEQELSRFSGGGRDNEVDSLRRENEQLRQTNFQQSVDMKINVMTATINDKLRGIESAVQQVGQARKENGSPHSTIVDSIALANAIAGQKQDPLSVLQFFLERGIVASPTGAPQSELGAKYAFNIEKLRADNALAAQREAQQAESQKELFKLGQHAVDVIGDPLSKGIANTFGKPGQATAAAPPMDPAAQVASLDQLIARAQEARANVVAKMEAAGTPIPGGTDPIATAQQVASVPEGQVISNAIARSMQAPTEYQVGQGQVHSQGGR